MAQFGAILVFIDSQNINDPIFQGGFDINCNFAPEKLYELAKMDGAIILDLEAQKILKANVHLLPDQKFNTPETGMRHRAADRTSQHLQCMVLAISKRRNALTIYYNKNKYLLKDVKLLLTRVGQALDTLEKYRGIFDDKLKQLNDAEIQNTVNLYDIIEIIIKGIKILRIKEYMDSFVVELGIEGYLVKVQLDENVLEMESYLAFIIMDYRNQEDCKQDNVKKDELKQERPEQDTVEEFTEEKAREMVNTLTKIRELSPLVVCKNLGYDFSNNNQIDEYPVSPHGYRFLKYVARLPMYIAKNLVDEFQSLAKIQKTDIETLKKVEGVGTKRATTIFKTLRRKYTDDRVTDLTIDF
jgi:diadenylate cyclase